MIKPTLVYLSLRRLILAMTFANESFFSVNVEYSAHFDWAFNSFRKWPTFKF